MSIHRPFRIYSSVPAAQIKPVSHQKREYIRATSCMSLNSMATSLFRMLVEWHRRQYAPWSSSAGRKAKAEQKRIHHSQHRRDSRRELALYQPADEAVFDGADHLPDTFCNEELDNYLYFTESYDLAARTD